MKAIELIADLRASLSQVKQQNRSEIPIVGLENYLSQMEKIALDSSIKTDEVETAQREQARLQFDRDMKVWEVQAKIQGDTSIEMFKAVIEAGLNALKSAVIINGGAAISLLAFVGNLLTKSAPTGTAFPISGLGIALLIFVLGVGCAGLGIAFRYLSQAAYGGSLKESNQSGGALDEAIKRAFLEKAVKFHMWGDRLRNVSISFGITSFLLFFAGGITAVMAIIR